MEFQGLIQKLQHALHEPLPGETAHRMLAPAGRLSTAEYLQNNPSYKSGSVAIVLFPDGESIRLLMTERAEKLSSHSGQISFPGGKRELDDASLEQTAMREMYEEVGVDPASVKIIGRLSELYIPVSNYLVHPFVGYATEPPVITINAEEVQSVIYPSLDDFQHSSLLTGSFESPLFGTFQAPYYPFQNLRIWGATAMMISELIYIIKK